MASRESQTFQNAPEQLQPGSKNLREKPSPQAVKSHALSSEPPALRTNKGKHLTAGSPRGNHRNQNEPLPNTRPSFRHRRARRRSPHPRKQKPPRTVSAPAPPSSWRASNSGALVLLPPQRLPHRPPSSFFFYQNKTCVSLTPTCPSDRPGPAQDLKVVCLTREIWGTCRAGSPRRVGGLARKPPPAPRPGAVSLTPVTPCVTRERLALPHTAARAAGLGGLRGRVRGTRAHLRRAPRRGRRHQTPRAERGCSGWKQWPPGRDGLCPRSDAGQRSGVAELHTYCDHHSHVFYIDSSTTSSAPGNKETESKGNARPENDPSLDLHQRSTGNAFLSLPWLRVAAFPPPWPSG